MVSNIFLGLGSNIDDRLKYLCNAVLSIGEDKNCSIIKASSVYETKPYGNIDQNNFYNAVILIESNYNVDDLYNFLKQVEQKLGRKKTNLMWAPREIDIDILFYNNLIYSNDILTIPHKEILNRDFVIVPLLEIAENFIHPVLNKKINELDLSLLNNHIIQKLNYSLV